MQETSLVRVVLSNGAQFEQTGTTRFERPNMVFEQSVDPVTGTLVVACDGRTVTVYSGKEDAYTRRTAPANLAGVMEASSRATQAVTGAATTQVLSPLSLALANGMPREAKSFRTAGSATVNGRKVVVVSAPADPAWLHAFVAASILASTEQGTASIHTLPSQVVLWIDPATDELLKSRALLAWDLTVRSGAAQHSTAMKLVFEATHNGIQLNPDLPASGFQYRPPAGSREIFQETR